DYVAVASKRPAGFSVDAQRLDAKRQSQWTTAEPGLYRPELLHPGAGEIQSPLWRRALRATGTRRARPALRLDLGALPGGPLSDPGRVAAGAAADLCHGKRHRRPRRRAAARILIDARRRDA